MAGSTGGHPRRIASRIGPETEFTIRQAGGERLLDARYCCVAGRYCAAVYLAGYCAEMALKWIGHELWRGLRQGGPVLQYGRWLAQVPTSFNVQADWAGGHGLGFWVEYVCGARRRLSSARGTALWSAGLERELRSRVSWFDDNWRVEMRYRPLLATRREALDAVRHARWLRRQMGALTR